MTMTGAEGELKQAYFRAATLGAWSFTGDRAGGTFTAHVLATDTFRLEQPGLSVVVPYGTHGALRWPILAMHIANGSLTATVGARE